MFHLYTHIADTHLFIIKHDITLQKSTFYWVLMSIAEQATQTHHSRCESATVPS